MIPNLQRRYRETSSEYIRSELERYMSSRPCPTCGGKRLRPEALAVTILERNIDEVSHFSVIKAIDWVETLAGVTARRPDADRRLPSGDRTAERGERAGTSELTGRTTGPSRQVRRAGSSGRLQPAVALRADGELVGSSETVPAGSPLSQREYTIARQILKELHARLRFLMDVGLDYLTLDRMAATLSGGEAQRIRLATQIGSQLMGVLYILDEPSIGLHQRDNARLIEHAAARCATWATRCW